MRGIGPRALHVFMVCLVLLLLAGLVAGCTSGRPAPAVVASPTAVAPEPAQPSPSPVSEPAPAPISSSAAADATSTVAADEPPVATLTIIHTPTPGPTPMSLDKTENILVLGMDTRPQTEIWRTDTIMVVVIDRSAGQVGIISIPRDLYVSIPGYGQERINAADYIGEKSKYPGGGPALVRRILNDNMAIPTQHYVRIKQDGLPKLVDALGGVEVTLPCPLYEAAPDAHYPGGLKRLALPAGKVMLDGPTAKQFVTYRYLTSDFGRERRQQQLIWAIRNRALKGDVIGRIPELWQALSDVFTTDLGVLDVVQLAGLGMRLQGKDIHAASLAADVMNYTTPEGGQVLLLRNGAAARARLSQIFAATPLAQVGQPDAAGCPRPPYGFPDLSPTATPAR